MTTHVKAWLKLPSAMTSCLMSADYRGLWETLLPMSHDRVVVVMVMRGDVTLKKGRRQ